MNREALKAKEDGHTVLDQAGLSEEHLKEYYVIRRVAMYTRREIRIAMGITKHQADVLELVALSRGLRVPAIDPKTRRETIDRLFKNFISEPGNGQANQPVQLSLRLGGRHE